METQQRKRLTWDQLQTTYPDTWVLLLNPDSPPTGYEVNEGDFIYKNKKQERVLEKAGQLPKGSYFRVIYTGNLSVPNDTVICL